MSVFKAYDIRGIYNKEFDKEVVYKIGYFLPQILASDTIAVGRDIRLSSDEVFDNLTRGITDAGCNVIDLGLATTPMVYFATCFLKVKGSVQITASHNSKEYNGLKISRENAIPVGGQTGLKDLEKLVLTGKIEPKKEKGKITKKNIYSDYEKFFSTFKTSFSDLNISFDLSNGMSNLFAKDLFKEGKNRHYINDSFDGSFPAHEPNPLVEANCEMLKGEVKKNKSDVGVIFDGDADRVVFINDKGEFIQPDYITAIIGYYYKTIGKTGNVVVDIRTSKSTINYLENVLGNKVEIWKVGHAFAKNKIREVNAIFGGELAGHYYFKDFFWCDSAIFAAFIVLSVVANLKKQGKTFSSFMAEIIKFKNSGENNFKLENKDEAIKEIYDTFSPNAKSILDFDGYRMDFGSWWFNIRKSNTEPYLRLICEADSEKEFEEKFNQLKSIVKKFN